MEIVQTYLFDSDFGQITLGWFLCKEIFNILSYKIIYKTYSI